MDCPLQLYQLIFPLRLKPHFSIATNILLLGFSSQKFELISLKRDEKQSLNQPYFSATMPQVLTFAPRGYHRLHPLRPSHLAGIYLLRQMG